MKKFLFSLLAILLLASMAFVFIGCENNDEPSEDPFETAIQADLVSRYDLIFTTFIWNDYQPNVAYPPRSTHFVGISTPQDFDLTQVQMSVQIVTSKINITRIFTLREYGGGALGGDFRSTEIFRLNDDEDYTLHISILIGKYTQTITLTGSVFVTH